MTALREERTKKPCTKGSKQQQIKWWSKVILGCSAKQATIYKWFSLFWLRFSGDHTCLKRVTGSWYSTIKKVDSWRCTSDVLKTKTNTGVPTPMHNKTALIRYSLLAIDPNKILFSCELSDKFLFSVYTIYSQHTIATCNTFLCAKLEWILMLVYKEV